MIIGINAREFGGPPDAAAVKKMIEASYGKLAAGALPLYGLTTSPNGMVTQGPPDPLYGTAGAQWSTDTAFRCPAVVVANWNSKAGHPTYQYQFDRGIPGHPEIGAVHASEVAYVFGTLDEQRPMRPNYDAADSAISKAMQEYWTNFAKTGNPDVRRIAGVAARSGPIAKRYLDSLTAGRLQGQACGARSARCLPRA